MGFGIREARDKLPALVKRAAHRNEEIRFGSRGSDEVTLMATAKLERLRKELEQLRKRVRELNASGGGPAAAARGKPARPFSGLQRALEAGQFAVGAQAGPRKRRYLPELRTESEISHEERVRIGSRGSAEPQYRRRTPRA